MSEKKYITMDELRGMVKNWDGKLYKVFADNKFAPTHGSPLAWTPGEWTERIEDVKMCERGWHLTTHYAHWWEGGDAWLAESDSIVEYDGYDKVVCERVRLVERVTTIDNSGYNNSGYYNSGRHNTGDHNSGSCNSGYNNSGDRNSGHYNSGNYNSGYYNSGNYNSGDHNSGSYNSGNYNSGHHNSGNWNTCDGPYLHLCTAPQYFLFNKPVESFPIFPSWFYRDGCPHGNMHAHWRKAFDAASNDELMEAITLPNFDYDVFEQITGISKADFDRRLGQ